MGLVLIFRLHALGYGIESVFILFFVLLFLFFFVHATSFLAVPFSCTVYSKRGFLNYFHLYSMSLKPDIIKFYYQNLYTPFLPRQICPLSDVLLLHPQISITHSFHLKQCQTFQTDFPKNAAFFQSSSVSDA